MQRFDYCIVGGGVAGVTAAETIREFDSRGSVAVISAEAQPLYSRVLLPHFVKGRIPRERLFLRTAEDYRTKGLALLAGESAVNLNSDRRCLRLESGSEIEFGKLLVAAGGSARRVGIPGEDLCGVSRFQTIQDADLMLGLLGNATRAVVAGGGFIALEYLEILAERRIPITLILREPYFFARHLDPVGGELLRRNFERHGIVVIAEDSLALAEGREALEGVRTVNGRMVECSFLGLGIGLARNTAWLSSSGLTLTPGGIRTNEFLETEVKGVFAAGDVAEFYDPESGNFASRGNWTNSFLQGRTSGGNMARPDAQQPFRAVSAYSIKSLDFVISFVGEMRRGGSGESIVRVLRDRNIYERFFIDGERLVGAVLINRPEDKSAVTALIQSGLRIAHAQERLADPSFNIATLSSEDDLR